MDNQHPLAELTQAYMDFYACVLSVPESLFLVSMDGWSPRDVVAHLIGWNGGMIAAVQTILHGESPVYYADAANDYKNINAAYAAACAAQSRDELLSQLSTSMQVFNQLISSLDPVELTSSYGVKHYSGRPATAAGVISSLAGDYTVHRKQIGDWLRSQGLPAA
jgi:hypothetical protein